jgi:pimeloyl-ACP methyl ester carboxylesterase
LALPGFPQCAASWAALAELVAPQGIRVIAFDQRARVGTPEALAA